MLYFNSTNGFILFVGISILLLTIIVIGFSGFGLFLFAGFLILSVMRSRCTGVAI